MERDLSIYKTIVIHEIGHYVSMELCKELYGFQKGVKEIKISSPDYAECVNNESIKIKNKRKSDKFSIYMTLIDVHGCLFQCAFKKKELDTCYRFSDYNIKCHGHDDYNGIHHRYGFTPKERKEILEYLKVKAIELRNSEKFIEYYSNLNLEKLFLETSGEILDSNGLAYIDLDELNDYSTQFIEYYKPVFQEMNNGLVTIQKKYIMNDTRK